MEDSPGDLAGETGLEPGPGETKQQTKLELSRSGLVSEDRYIERSHWSLFSREVWKHETAPLNGLNIFLLTSSVVCLSVRRWSPGICWITQLTGYRYPLINK